MATKLWYGFEHVPAKTRKELKTFLADLKKALKDDAMYVYLDDAYDYEDGYTQLTIKITNADALKIASQKLKAKYGVMKSGENFVTNKLVNVKLYKSGGMRGTGKLPRKGESQKNPSTPEQESGTIVYFRERFKNKMPSLKQISKEVGYEFSDEWMWNFQEQYVAFVTNMGVIKGANVYLDSAKNESDIIVDLAKKFGLKDAKDNWNPADIWIMKIKPSQIKKETAKFTSLEEYNAYLEEKYNKKEIIGVSLKKVDQGKKGKFKTVSVKNLKKVDVHPNRVLFDPYQKNFIFETYGNIDGFNLRVGYKAASITKESDVRIYLEGRQKGSSVQLGAVSSLLFPELAKKYGGFNISTDKNTIFKDPQKYLDKHLPKLISNSAVTYKGVDNEDATDLQLKAAAFLTYYLKILLESDSELLNKCYYSSTKTNDFSSIHCKLF